MRKGKRVLLFTLMVGVMFVMTACGNGTENQTNGTNTTTTGVGNTNGATSGTGETTTNVGNTNNVETIPNNSNSTNPTENGTDGGVLTDLGDDIMNGVDEFATDIGIGTDNAGENGNGMGTGASGTMP